MFKLHIELLQCKQIIFGGSADNGYARLFGPYTGNSVYRERITLLEGPPFASELASLVDKFHTTSFPAVFRSTKISARPVPFSVTPPRSTSPRPSTYAASLQSLPAQTASLPARPVAPRNSQGQRVDLPLGRVPQDLVDILKPKKLCNTHHLAGYCLFARYGKRCKFDHDKTLNRQEIVALRFIARLSPCNQGLGCDNVNCIFGHQCYRPYCPRNDCDFPPEMHGVDQRMANR